MSAKDPISGGDLSIRNGRFGAYVTDGEVNASLRKGDTIEDLTPERAAELLQMRRERMAAKGTKPKKKAAKSRASGATKKKSTKKATKKKSTKKTAKKATAKKAAKKATTSRASGATKKTAKKSS